MFIYKKFNQKQVYNFFSFNKVLAFLVNIKLLIYSLLCIDILLLFLIRLIC